MLVAMATGTGKTKIAIALLYRLLSAKRFRRICFVVDRSALGIQTEGEFSTTKVVSGKTFAEIFGLKGLEDVTPELETKVHICTIQGLVKRVLFAADTSEALPVDQYDLMVSARFVMRVRFGSPQTAQGSRVINPRRMLETACLLGTVFAPC